MVAIDQITANAARLKELLPEGQSLFDWLGDADLGAFEDHDSVPREDAAFAYGYLQGCADTLNMTLLELVDAFASSSL